MIHSDLAHEANSVVKKILVDVEDETRDMLGMIFAVAMAGSASLFVALLFLGLKMPAFIPLSIPVLYFHLYVAELRDCVWIYNVR